VVVARDVCFVNFPILTVSDWLRCIPIKCSINVPVRVCGRISRKIKERRAIHRWVPFDVLESPAVHHGDGLGWQTAPAVET